MEYREYTGKTVEDAVLFQESIGVQPGGRFPVAGAAGQKCHKARRGGVFFRFPGQRSLFVEIDAVAGEGGPGRAVSGSQRYVRLGFHGIAVLQFVYPEGVQILRFVQGVRGFVPRYGKADGPPSGHAPQFVKVCLVIGVVFLDILGIPAPVLGKGNLAGGIGVKIACIGVWGAAVQQVALQQRQAGGFGQFGPAVIAPAAGTAGGNQAVRLRISPRRRCSTGFWCRQTRCTPPSHPAADFHPPSFCSLYPPG